MKLLDEIRRAGREGCLLGPAVNNICSWVEAGFLPEWALESIAELAGDGAWEELNNRFYRYLAFGTGGMRGRTIAQRPTAGEVVGGSKVGVPRRAAVGSATLNDFNIVRATIGLYRYCEGQVGKDLPAGERPTLVVAHDVRYFSRHFCELTASTWCQLGGRALVFSGPRSTPQLSFAVRWCRASAGVEVTASHNPPYDNGYKVYFSDGAQVVFPHAEGIIEQVQQVVLGEITPYLKGNMTGVERLSQEADRAYLEVLGENVVDAAAIRAVRPRVVFTPIHGTGGVISLPLMRQHGVEVVEVEEQMAMDPAFPTVESPNPENAEALALAIAKAGKVDADAVIATDPDADRMGIAVPDSHGKMAPLTGNRIGAVLLNYRIEALKRDGRLPLDGSRSAILIKTFVTTSLQTAIAERHGLKVINTLTGFKYIGEKLKHYEKLLVDALEAERGVEIRYDALDERERRERMLRHGSYFVFGGEESYGYLSSDRVRDKDANGAAILFCEFVAALKGEGRSVAEYLDLLYLRHGYYHEDQLSLVYGGAAGVSRIARILESYREDPPREMGNGRVIDFVDYGRDEILDADGWVIPKQDLFLVQLDNGCSYAVRGSGTEPKIKFYLFGREDVPEPAALEPVKEAVRKEVARLKEALESDGRERAR